MVRDDYIKAIRESTSKAEIDALSVRASKDEEVKPFDLFFIGFAIGERFNTPVCEL